MKISRENEFIKLRMVPAGGVFQCCGEGDYFLKTNATSANGMDISIVNLSTGAIDLNRQNLQSVLYFPQAKVILSETKNEI